MPEKGPESGRPSRSFLSPETWPAWKRWVVAFVPPALAFAVEWQIYDRLAPYVWFPFFLSLIFTAWLAGLRPAIVTSAATSVVAYYAFAPPRFAWGGQPRYAVAAGTLFVASCIVALLIDRLRRTNARSTRSNEQLKILEASLRASVEDLERAQAVAKVGSWRSVEGETFDLSDEAHRILGTTPGKRISFSEFVAIVHPSDRAYIEERWHAAVTRGEPYEVEYRLCVAGRIKCVRAKADLEFDDAGRLVSAIGIAQDITERKRLEDELRRSREHLDMAIAGADMATWEWNTETGELIHNARWAELRGYAPGEIAPRVASWFDSFHPDDLPRVWQALTDQFEGRTSEYSVQARVATKDGRWVWILQQGKVLARDEHGRPLRIAGTSLDITRQRRIEMEQRFLAEVGPLLDRSLVVEQTLSALADLVVRELADYCVIDLVEDSGEIRRAKVACSLATKQGVADEFARLPLGSERAPILLQVLHGGQTLLFETVASAQLEEWARNEEHLRLLRATDVRSLVWVPLIGHDRVLGGLGIASATSGRRYTSDDLGLAEDLARRASLSLENARLYRAAEQAVVARDDVMGVVAHDLRNPLATILMQAAVLEGGVAEREGPVRKAAERIQRAARRMQRLIQDLLDISCVEAGQLVLDRAALPARDVAAEAVETQRPLAAAAAVELRLDVAAQLPRIFADRHRVLQVFENLIGNALKFTPSGGRVIVGSVPLGGSVLCYVRDTGPGIPTDDQPHLFDRFWQARRSRMERGSGAGLGLAIVKGIVEAHDGRVWIESAPGEGSTFYFTLPTRAVAELGQPAAAP
jgi:PAS domain S-box-containing protein